MEDVYKDLFQLNNIYNYVLSYIISHGYLKLLHVLLNNNIILPNFNNRNKYVYDIIKKCMDNKSKTISANIERKMLVITYNANR